MLKFCEVVVYFYRMFILKTLLVLSGSFEIAVLRVAPNTPSNGNIIDDTYFLLIFTFDTDLTTFDLVEL